MIAIYSYRVVCISTQCNISLFKFMIYKKGQHLWFTVSVRITLALSGGCPWCDFRTGYEKTICGLILWLQLRFKRKMSSFSLLYVQGLTMENLKKSWNFKTTLQKWVENRVEKKKKWNFYYQLNMIQYFINHGKMTENASAAHYYPAIQSFKTLFEHQFIWSKLVK